MRIPDIFKLNDWENRKFVLVILSVLLVYDNLVLLDIFLFKIPILPQLLGFFILTFIPGFIILKILKIHNIDRILNILLVIGLSMFFNTLLGFILSETSFIFNFITISSISLFVTYNIILVTLLLVCFFRYNEFNTTNEKLEVSLSQISLFLILPSCAVLGAYFINLYNTNYINVLLIIAISLMPFLFKFKHLYTTIIWISAITILFSTQLISNYLWAWDIHVQYYVASLVIENGYWDPNFYSGINSLLSIVLLAPIYSLFLDLDLVWVFKIVNPFLFSFVPLGVYYLSNNQFNNSRIAFFSSFVFMFYYGFFKDMIDKQYIAELFLILTLIVITDKDLKDRKALLIPFLFMIPLSHYGVSYLLMIAFLFIVSVFYVLKLKDQDKLSTNVVVLFIVFVFGWYMYTSTGATFNNLIYKIEYVIMRLTEVNKTEMRSGVYYLNFPAQSLIWKIHKMINIALVLFISIGIMRLFISFLERKNIIKNYIFGLIAIAFSVFLFYQIFQTLGLAMDRSLQITLTVLSPFAVLGFMCLPYMIYRKLFSIKPRVKQISLLFSLFLFIFFLFSSGLVHEMSKEPLPYAIALNKNPEWHVYSSTEVEGAKWIKNNGNENDIAILSPHQDVKSRDGTLISGIYPYKKIIPISLNSSIVTDSYIFTGTTNNNDSQEYPFYSVVIPRSNNIYNSGDSKIYLSGDYA